MAKPIRYTATFSDGTTLTRGSHREYQSAWRVIITEREIAPNQTERRTWTLTGFARTPQLAVKTAAAESRRGCWADRCDVQTEIAPTVAA